MISRILQIQKVTLSFSVCLGSPRECFTSELMVRDSELMVRDNVLQPGAKEQNSSSIFVRTFSGILLHDFWVIYRDMEFLY